MLAAGFIGLIFPATQDFLASALGVKRPTVTLVAHSSQEAGLIRYHRRRVRIAHRAGLEKSACDCYQVTKAAYQRIMGS